MLARFALLNSKFIPFVVLVLAALGVRAYFTTAASIFPAMTFSRVDVVVDAGNLPPDRVAAAIARPLGQALQTLPGVERVVATSSQGAAEFIVSFADGTSPDSALQLVDRATARMRASIPEATSILAEPVAVNREPVVSFALTSDLLSQTVLRQLALAQIVPKLYGTAGLGRVTVSGGADPEYHVVLDPARLQAAGIAASDVASALAAGNELRSAGALQRHDVRYTLLVDGMFTGKASLEQFAIPLHDGTIPLRALGTVALGTSPKTYQTSLDGRSAVILSAYAAADADTVGMARALENRVDAIVPSLPAQVSLAPFWDATTLIVASQTALRDAILCGALLAVLVIYAFLRNVRLTLVAAAVIPLAMAIAVFALHQAGETLNLMSVGGLAVAVGLIIDDAIVVIEAIARRRRLEPQRPLTETIQRVMADLTVPMTASTLATVVVFLPLALLGGVTGFFFRALAFTLSASLLVSLALALFVAPVLARALLGSQREHSVDAGHAKGGGRYERILGWALGHRTAVVLCSAGILAVTVALLASLPNGFLPAMDEGEFEIGYALPPGLALAAGDGAARTMERVIAADSAVAAVAGLSGIDSNGVSPTQPSQGTLRVRLVEPNRRSAYPVVAERLRERLSAAVPAATLDFRQILEDMIDDLSGTPAPIDISIFGDDAPTLDGLAQKLAGKTARVPSVVDVATSVRSDGPTIRLEPRGAGLAAAHADGGQLADAIAALEGGAVATSIAGSQTVVPVRLAVGSGPSAGFDAGAPLSVGGTSAPLATFGRLHVERASNDIITENGRLVAHVTAGFDGASLSAVTAGIGAALRSMALPPGYDAQIGGQARAQARSFSEFETVIGLAVILVYAVMLATFRSFRIPLVVLSAVPLALIGVAAALALTRTAFNVSSFMGLLLLVGVVVKNGILLVDVAHRRQAAGDSVTSAIVVAGKTRLRPIVMTTLAAIGGLAPLALGIGQGSEMERPLAIAVIGGLSTATLFTLIAIPVFYAMLLGRTHRPAAARALALVVFATLAAAHPTGVRAAETAVPHARLVFAHLSLAEATAAALATAPDVRVARAVVDERRAALAAARGTLAPSLVTNYAQLPQGNPPGPNILSRQVSAALQFAFADVFGASSAGREAAYGFVASQLDERAAESTERVKVATLYFDALKARAQAFAAAEAFAAATRERDAARVRFAAGDAARLDVIRSDVSVARASAAMETADVADANAREALTTEVATNDPLDLTAPQALGDDAPLLAPAAAVALARTARPEIASAARAADAARAALAGARIATVPALTVGGGFLTGTDSGVPVNAPIITAGLTIPLGAAGSARVREAEARAVEAQARAASIERSILLDVAASARSAAALARVLVADDGAVDAARAGLTATETGYASGASSSLELASARTAYEQALGDDVSARYDLAKARAILDIEAGK